MAITKSLFNFSFGNATHVGQVRQANEDYYGNFETKNGYIFLVCDGMGGHVGGTKAAQIAVQTIKDCLQQIDYPNPCDALSQAIVAANKAILDYSEQHPELEGMGTTCVAVLIVGSDVFYAHVGDSRIYLFSNKKLYRITKDHSFVQNMIDLGGLTEKEAENHPRKNEITNALGLKNMKPPTVCQTHIRAAKNDIFLLCSDGLTGMVSDAKLNVVLGNSMDLQKKADFMIELANKAGGTDNITVQIIQITHSPYLKTITGLPEPTKGKNPTPKIPKNIKKIALILISLLLILLFLFSAKFYFDRGNIIPKKNQTTLPEETTKTNKTEGIELNQTIKKDISNSLSPSAKDDDNVKSENENQSKETTKNSNTIEKKEKAESIKNSSDSNLTTE